ncbi:MAG TPA: chemotaxis protein CheR [Paenibacillaceae bacterium]|nr:chemotaxis protein CheR [Paenibacillaceae bacterium]
MEDRDFLQFIQNIKIRTGIDLSYYKEPQMKRRLTSLRLRRGYQDFASFYQALRKNRELYDEFLDRMTINVSEFFRNQDRWKALEDNILPRLHVRNKSLKCWSAACSTGEEPYSLAMILTKHGLLDHAEILATDIDNHALEKARQGVYSERAVQSVPGDFYHAFFKKEGNTSIISARLREKVQFQKHNLLADPYGSDFDLIICRNVMIYFTEEAKQKLYNQFSKALRPGGILFVGILEQIFRPQQYELEPIDTFFYRKV